MDRLRLVNGDEFDESVIRQGQIAVRLGETRKTLQDMVADAEISAAEGENKDRRIAELEGALREAKEEIMDIRSRQMGP